MCPCPASSVPARRPAIRIPPKNKKEEQPIGSFLMHTDHRGAASAWAPYCGWAIKDSNLGPTGYEPGALTN